MTDLLVAPCSYEAAAYAVRHWHYSAAPPHSRLVKLGVWEDGTFVGVVLFGDGANFQMFRPFEISQNEGAELVRVALRSHQAPVSQIVARAVRSLRSTSPGLRLLLSFADPEQGHHGGIYQAGNWIYLGMTASADEYLVKGRRMHGRALRSTRSTHRLRDVQAENVLEWARKVLDPQARPVPGSTKHRYALPLDRAMRRRLEPLRQPAPHRA